MALFFFRRVGIDVFDALDARAAAAYKAGF